MNFFLKHARTETRTRLSPRSQVGIVACWTAGCCQEAHAISRWSLCVSTQPPHKPPIHSLKQTRVWLLPPALPVKLRFAEVQIPLRNTVGGHQSALTIPPFLFWAGKCFSLNFKKKFRLFFDRRTYKWVCFSSVKQLWSGVQTLFFF